MTTALPSCHRTAMQLCVRVVASAAVPLACITSAQAQETTGWQKGDIVVSAGVSQILFNSSAEISLAGNKVTDGNVKLSNNTILTGTIEYFATRNISVALVGGIPPTTKVTGTGSLTPLGEVGRVKYGLGSLVGRYHFNASGRLSPYLGAGVSRFMVFGTKDGSVTSLRANSAWAPVAQGGIDYHLGGRTGLFANVTYIPVKTEATGISRGLPLTGNATIKATIFKGGLTYRF